jgi:TRAP-type C4-dicarboxylate transport system permease small subunit
MHLLKKLDESLSRLARVITAFSIFIQMVVMFLGVIFRYFLKNPLTWSDELSTYLLVFVTFFGSYVALKDKALANIELAVNKLPRPARRIVVLIANLTTTFLLGAVVCFGIMLCLSPAVLNTNSPSMNLPTVIFYAVLPIAAFMMVVHMICAAYDDFHGDTGENSGAKEDDQSCR